MIPADVQQWMRDQIWGLSYRYPDLVFAHSLDALNTHSNLRPRTEYNDRREIVLTLFSIDGPQLILHVPYMYPNESPRLLVNGVQVELRADLIIMDALRSYLSKQTPPKVPSKVPSQPSSPSLPPKPSLRWQRPLPTPELPSKPVDQISALSQPPKTPLSTPWNSPHPSVPVDLMNSATLKSSPSSVERTQALTELYITAMALPNPSADIHKRILNDQFELEQTEKQIMQRSSKLNQIIKQLEVNIDALTTAISQAEHVMYLADSQFVPPTIDDLITVSDAEESKSKAADQAINDLFTILSTALDSGAIEIHVYLRLVRQYAREQFSYRLGFNLPARPPKDL